jgi:hypothetical protein
VCTTSIVVRGWLASDPGRELAWGGEFLAMRATSPLMYPIAKVEK